MAGSSLTTDSAAAAGKQEVKANAKKEERPGEKVVAMAMGSVMAEWCSHRDVRLGQKRKGKRE